MNTELLIERLSVRGIIVTLVGDEVKLRGPERLLTDADVDPLRKHKPAILAYLRSHHGTANEPLPERATEPLHRSPIAPTCQFCGASDRVPANDPNGVRCNACGHLIEIGEGEARSKVQWHDHDCGSMAPEGTPVCDRCTSLCDTELVSGDWRCSRCDPNATVRTQKKASDGTDRESNMGVKHDARAYPAH